MHFIRPFYVIRLVFKIMCVLGCEYFDRKNINFSKIYVDHIFKYFSRPKIQYLQLFVWQLKFYNKCTANFGLANFVANTDREIILLFIYMSALFILE